MSLKYADVVYTERDLGLVWCECKATMHTLVEVRYQLILFEASEEYAPHLIYRKGKKLAESSWKKTPKECRDQLRDAQAVQLNRSDIVWEDTVAITIPIFDEKF